MSNHYLILYRPSRPTFAEDATSMEREVVGRHFEYLQQLLADGVLLVAGRRDDAAFGIAIVCAENEAQARSLVEEDPSVREDVFTGEVYLFRLALMREQKQ